MEFSDPLDEGIREYVEVLFAAGIETYESCQGGVGHSYPEPSVRFHGTQACGWKALTVVQHHGFPVKDLSRIWTVIDGEPIGPEWQMTFWRESNPETR